MQDTILESIKTRYLAGESTRSIASNVGISKSQVWVWVDRLGIGRSKCEANPRGIWTKPESVHWRTMRQRARRIWELANGEIPAGFHVHHKNRDYTDNSVENLELLGAREHAHEHQPPNPIPRWHRPKTRAYMKAYLHEYHKRNPSRKRK